MAISIPISALAHCLDRSEPFVRMTLRSLALPHEDRATDLSDAVKLIRYFASKSGEHAKLVSDLEAQIDSTKKRELEFSIALEIVKRERNLLSKQTETLAQQLQQANDRAYRFEAKLHQLTDSFAHLLDQRDRLVAQTPRKTSRAVEVYQNGKSILMLKDPVSLRASANSIR